MKRAMILVLTFFVVLAGVSMFGCASKAPADPEPAATNTPTTEPTPVPTVYDFSAAGQVSDWGNDTYETTLAITAVSHADSGGEAGDGALRATADLNNTTPGYNQGAVMRTAAMDLTGRTISVKMYIPAGLISADADNPNEVALYIQGKSDWSGWSDEGTNLDSAMADSWQTFTFTPDVDWIGEVQRIGVQVRIKETSADYTGDIDFDEIKW